MGQVLRSVALLTSLLQQQLPQFLPLLLVLLMSGLRCCALLPSRSFTWAVADFSAQSHLCVQASMLHVAPTHAPEAARQDAGAAVWIVRITSVCDAAWCLIACGMQERWALRGSSSTGKPSGSCREAAIVP